MKLFELQKAYNIYKKTYQLQAELFQFFASDQMHRAFMVFLSKLAFAAHFIHPINEELLAVSREDVVKEMSVSKNFSCQVVSPHHKTCCTEN